MWARRATRAVFAGIPVLAAGKLVFFPYRLHLVFDLDATLIDTTRERNAVSADVHLDFDNRSSHYSVYFRPYAKFILGSLKHTNGMYMFTAATRDYTDRILDKLAPGAFEEILYREATTTFPRRLHHRVPRSTKYSKDLRRLKAIGDSDEELSRAVLIDDKATNQVADQHIIVVHPYDIASGGAWRDVELLKVAATILLCNIGGAEVTRYLLRSPPGTHTARATDH